MELREIDLKTGYTEKTFILVILAFRLQLAFFKPRVLRGSWIELLFQLD